MPFTGIGRGGWVLSRTIEQKDPRTMCVTHGCVSLYILVHSGLLHSAWAHGTWQLRCSFLQLPGWDNGCANVANACVVYVALDQARAGQRLPAVADDPSLSRILSGSTVYSYMGYLVRVPAVELVTRSWPAPNKSALECHVINSN
jgi:hypothetical protein